MARANYRTGVDASVGKSWKLSERFRLQFRGEVVNVVNHPLMSTSSIRKNLYSSGFGEVRGTLDVWASNLVIGSGGSRHIQLGLKVVCEAEVLPTIRKKGELLVSSPFTFQTLVGSKPRLPDFAGLFADHGLAFLAAKGTCESAEI